MKTGNLFWRKVWIYSLRTLASLFLLSSLLLTFAVRLSDAGDVVDRNAGWILLILLTAVCAFIGSFLIKRDPADYKRRQRSIDELLDEVRKPNLKKN